MILAKEALISKMHTIVVVFDVNFTRRVQSIYLFNFDKNDLIHRLGMLTWNVHCEPCKQESSLRMWARCEIPIVLILMSSYSAFLDMSDNIYVPNY